MIYLDINWNMDIEYVDHDFYDNYIVLITLLFFCYIHQFLGYTHQ